MDPPFAERVSGHATVRSRSPDLSPPGDARRVVTVAIAGPLDAELVASIRAVGDRVSVLYQPQLLPPTRYPGDHRGVDGFRRDPEDESRWQEMLAQAFRRFARGARELLKAAGLTRVELERIVVTSASGVPALAHAAS